MEFADQILGTEGLEGQFTAGFLDDLDLTDFLQISPLDTFDYGEMTLATQVTYWAVIQKYRYNSGDDGPLTVIGQNGAEAILTSATLTAVGRFDRFLERAGLQGRTALRIQSPFDFPNIAQFVVPPLSSEPRDFEAHTDEVATLLPELIGEGPSALVLFTSWRQMFAVLDRMDQSLRPLLKVRLLPSEAVEDHDELDVLQRPVADGLVGVLVYDLPLPWDRCKSRGAASWSRAACLGEQSPGHAPGCAERGRVYLNPHIRHVDSPGGRRIRRSRLDPHGECVRSRTPRARPPAKAGPNSRIYPAGLATAPSRRGSAAAPDTPMMLTPPK